MTIRYRPPSVCDRQGTTEEEGCEKGIGSFIESVQKILDIPNSLGLQSCSPCRSSQTGFLRTHKTKVNILALIHMYT